MVDGAGKLQAGLAVPGKVFKRVLSVLRRILRFAGAFVWIAAALVLLFIASGFVHIPGISRISWLIGKNVYATTGYIYVESPEVYTRERLVNDRYDQDHWLKLQLDRTQPETDETGRAIPTSVISTRRSTSTTVTLDVGQAGDSSPGDAPRHPPLPVIERLDLRSDFQVQASVRDTIRQSVLENALDDRHDLTGNTIYGLKFDTAVIPGSNTYRSPVVLISMNVDPFSGTERDSGISTFHDRVLYRQSGRRQHAPSPAFESISDQFDEWRRNIEHNLNNYINQSCRNRDLETTLSIVFRGPDKRRALAANVSEESKQKLFDETGERLLAGFPYRREDNSMGGINLDLPGVIPDVPTVDPYAGLKFLSMKQYDLSKQEIELAFGYMFGVDARSIDFPELEVFDGDAEFFETRYLELGFEVDSEINRYFDFSMDFGRGASDGCVLPVVRVQKAIDHFYISAGDLPVAGFPERNITQRSLAATDETGAMDYRIVFDLDVKYGDIDIFTERFASDLRKILTDLAEGSAADVCADEFLDDTGSSAGIFRACKPEDPDNVKMIGIVYDAGLFAFLDSVYRSNAYAYAVFPKADVTGVIDSTDSRAAGTFGGAFNAGLDARSASENSRADIGVINFATGRNESIRFDFGWAFLDPGLQRSGHLSQTVLLSVPAFLKELKLTVRTGWLDPDDANSVIDRVKVDGNQDETLSETDRIFASALLGYRRLEMTVPLPPDYEALGSLIDSGEGQRKPRISPYREKCEPDPSSQTGTDTMVRNVCDVVVRAGSTAKFVVEGVRLWRSTVVTLNGQIADRIQVLPDMRGIVATFKKVDEPYFGGSDVVPARLKIWTSEGSVDSDQNISIARADTNERPGANQ